MACNCGSNPCSQQPTCTCPVKDLRTDCSVYNGPTLGCSGIESGTILTQVLQQLDAFICTTRDEILTYVNTVATLINVGGGAEVFKGINGLGNRELRTIISQDTNLLDVVQSTDTIGIRPGAYQFEFDSDTNILTVTVETASGVTTVANLDLSSLDLYLEDANFSEINQELQLSLSNGTSLPVDLSFLNNHLESVVYNPGTNNLEFTLTDATVLTVSVTAIFEDAQIQADVLETNTSSKAYIQNKNPNKSVVLGVAGNYNVVDADNNYVIEIDNGANDVTINLAGITITDNYFVGFVQKGTGTVTFTNYDLSPDGLGDIIFGQAHVASCQVINSTKYIHGNLKAA